MRYCIVIGCCATPSTDRIKAAFFPFCTEFADAVTYASNSGGLAVAVAVGVGDGLGDGVGDAADVISPLRQTPNKAPLPVPVLIIWVGAPPAAILNRQRIPSLKLPLQKVVPSGSRFSAKKLLTPATVYVWITLPLPSSRLTSLLSAIRSPVEPSNGGNKRNA